MLSLQARRRRLAGDEQGFTMIEVVVSMALFTVVLGAVLGIVTKLTGTMGNSNRRVVAANLATKQIEASRSQKALAIPDGLVTRTEVVGSTTYTIKQTSNFLPSDSAASVCTGSGNNLAYKLVSVDVTWPRMGSVKPVHSDTLRALGIGADGLDPTQGAAAIAVVSGTGSPVSGVRVTLQPGGATTTTGADGCAVFVGLADGANYTATVDELGYVSNNNTQVQQNTNIGIRASEVTRGTFLYDTSAKLDLTWGVPSDYPVPTGLPLKFRNSYLSDRSYPDCASLGAVVAGCVQAMPGRVLNLFPTTYDIWAGGCGQRVTVGLLAGGTTSAQVPLSAVRVRFVDQYGQPQPARAVTAAGCTSESWPLGSVGPTETKGALPAGTWTLTAAGANPVTVTPGAGVTDVQMVVAP